MFTNFADFLLVAKILSYSLKFKVCIVVPLYNQQMFCQKQRKSGSTLKILPHAMFKIQPGVIL